MTITTLLDPTLLPARTMDQSAFDAAMAYLMTNLPTWGAQTNALQANLNSIAAGGAYAIPYTFDSSIAAGPAAGYLRIGSTTQNAATSIQLSTTRGGGGDVTATIEAFDDSTSTVKGHLRIQKQTDTSAWLEFDVTGWTTASGYRYINVIPANSSSANPFVNGDPLMLFFQRTGDKGDAGSLTSVLWVRDEKASGTGGGSAGAGTYVTRVLNTTKKNSISGASVSSNQITLPAGTYRSTIFAPANNVGAHQAYLYNVTDAVTQVVGTNAYAGTSTVTTQSVIGQAEFTLTASKVFEIRHWTNTGTASTGLGNAVSSGQGEVYTQVFIEKVS